MNAYIFTEILQRVAALLALAVIFDLVTTRFKLDGHPHRLLAVGLAVGLLGIGVMASPLRLEAGVVIDPRSVILAVSGVFFGAVPTVIAMVVTAAYRLYVGGDAAFTGVLVIAASGTIGIAWRAWRQGRVENIGPVELYALGLVVHGVMLALMLTLPQDLPGPILTTITLPLLAVFPLATAALGTLLVSRLKRERVAARLEQSEARYRSLFQNNHAVMLVSDPADGRIVDANPAAERFYGWSRERIRELSMSDVEAAATDDESTTAASINAATPTRTRHRTSSGDICDVEVRSGEVEVDGRDLVYAIIHDVTAERVATDALRLRSAALEAVPNAILITDPEGLIEWVNPAFTRSYGYSFDEVAGRNPRDVIKAGVQNEEFYRDLWQTILSGETWAGLIVNRRKDGTLLEEDMAITPLRDSAGRITHFIAVKQDLTRWRALEQKLALAQKLESVGRLAGGVAHDFNNLLAVINGILDLVLSKLPDQHELHDDLSEVREAGARASTLTRQLLAFGRQQVLVREPVDLNELIRNMTKMLRRLIGDDIAIVTDLEEDLAPVLGDHGQLEQVITNLAVNARDAMPGGGTLSIATKNLYVTLSGRDAERPTHVRLVVRDTGEGIDPAVQPHIFDPFFTTKEPGKGTGLGLATVYGVVRQSGGDIQFETGIGTGTAFEIRLRCAHEVVERPDTALDSGSSVQ
ncbi:MAG: PAS domain S-box protein [Gemmatimonadetes bacterium]|nr:PAS domain S-box protein [Gemmatimonadota bacterium]